MHVPMIVFMCVIDRNSSVYAILHMYIYVRTRLFGQKNVIIKIVIVAIRQNGRDKMYFIWKLTNNCSTKKIRKTYKNIENVAKVECECLYFFPLQILSTMLLAGQNGEVTVVKIKSIVVWTTACAEHVLNRNAFRHWNRIIVIDSYAKCRGRTLLYFGMLPNTFSLSTLVHLLHFRTLHPLFSFFSGFFFAFCSTLAAINFYVSMDIQKFASVTKLCRRKEFFSRG